MPMTSGLLVAVVEAVGVFALLLLLLSDLFDDVEAQAERAAAASARATAVVMRRAVRYSVVCLAGRVDLDVWVRSRTVAVDVMVDNFWVCMVYLARDLRAFWVDVIGFGCARALDCVRTIRGGVFVVFVVLGEPGACGGLWSCVQADGGDVGAGVGGKGGRAGDLGRGRDVDCCEEGYWEDGCDVGAGLGCWCWVVVGCSWRG